MGDKLTDSAEVLFRQIHPDLMQDGEPASSGFRPNDGDENKLSVDRGALTTSEASYALYTGNGYASAAVYGVSIGEFDGCGIPCESDPIDTPGIPVANPAHALASFVGYGTSKQKTLGKRLKKLAIARGLLHPLAPGAQSQEDELP
jgi:hypothetical protein